MKLINIQKKRTDLTSGQNVQKFMKLISIQKKPPLGWELLMVFIISLYFNPFISIPYGAIKRSLVDIIALGIIAFQFLMVRLFLQRYKIYFNKTNGI